MDLNANDYQPRADRRRGWAGVIVRKVVEGYLRRNARQLLAQGVPQFFVVSQDHISNRILLGGFYERGYLDAAFEMLRANVRLKGVAIDAGANIGNHSLYFSRHYDRVLSFEPNPRLDLVLRANAALVGNIECFCLGLSDRASDSKLRVIDGYNLGSSTIIEDAGQKLAAVYPISLARLDDIDSVKGVDVGLIKIDVENWELQVLTGSVETLARCSPLVLFEQHERCFASDGSDSAVVSFLRAQGYDFFYEVDIFPRWQTGAPKHLRNAIQHIWRLVAGYSFQIRPIDRFHKRFYSFIIASKTALRL